MEVKIGVIYSARELSIETDGKADEVAAAVEAALANGSPVFWLTDKKGSRVGVASDKISYIEIVEEEATKRVGFGTA